MSNTQQRFKLFSRWVVFCGFFFILTGCEGANAPISSPAVGGSEVGNPPIAGTRTVKGHIATTADESADCANNEVQFVDSRGSASVAAVNAACDFSSALATDATYLVTLTTAADDVGTKLAFVNADGEVSAFYLGEGNDPVDLGDIVYDGDSYVASNDPAGYSDADGDGLIDGADSDDDNDGVLDIDEADCDEDGISDDFDLASTCSSSSRTLSTTTTNTVAETLPEPEDDQNTTPSTLAEAIENNPETANNPEGIEEMGNPFSKQRTLHPVDAPDADGRLGRTLHPVGAPDGDGRPGKTLHPVKQNKNADKHPAQKKEKKETFWQWLNPFN